MKVTKLIKGGQNGVNSFFCTAYLANGSRRRMIFSSKDEFGFAERNCIPTVTEPMTLAEIRADWQLMPGAGKVVVQRDPIDVMLQPA